MTEGVELVIELLDSTYFDENKFKRYIYSKVGKIFFSHERELRRRTSPRIVELEIKKVINNPKYRDSYGFYILKENIELVKKDLEYIKSNEVDIISQVLEQIYRYVPMWVEINPNITLYVGGVDGGFATFTKDVYINYIKYIGNIEEFKKVLAHEFYHARLVPISKKIKLFLKKSFYINRAKYDSLGRIFEEGIACLIEHGVNFETDDPVGTLTNRDILLKKEHFEVLNEALFSIKQNNPDYNLIYKINVYVIGYIISKMIYENEGSVFLNQWTVNFNYEILIQKYIEICKETGIASGFDRDIEKWLQGKHMMKILQRKDQGTDW